MVEERVGRRAIIGVGAGLLASLAGCSRLFIEPEPTTRPGQRTATATPEPADTATPEPTATAEPTATKTPTPELLPGNVVDVRNKRLSIQRSQLEKFAYVDYRFAVENTGRRVINDIEFRVELRYEHEEISRIVATSYPRFWFDQSADNGGLQRGETDTVSDRLRFERDGRAEESTDTSRFSLGLTVRRIRYR